MNELTILEDYGPLKAGKSRQMHSEGYDFFRIKAKGHLYSIPKCFFRGYEKWVADVKKKIRKIQKPKKKNPVQTQRSNRK